MVGKGGIAACAGGGEAREDMWHQHQFGNLSPLIFCVQNMGTCIGMECCKKTGGWGKIHKAFVCKVLLKRIKLQGKENQGKENSCTKKKWKTDNTQKTALWLPPVVRLNEITTETGKWKSTLPKCTDQSE